LTDTATPPGARVEAEVALDSSTLGRIVDEEKLDDFVGALPSGSRIVLPEETLAEFLSVDSKWTGGRVRALGILWNRVGWRLVLASPIHVLLARERGAPILQTPRVERTSAILESLRKGSNDSPGDFQGLRRAIAGRLQKEAHLELDASFKTTPPMLDWTPNLVNQAACSIASADGFWEGFFMQAVIPDDTNRRAARANPGQYRFAVTLAAYAFLNGLGTVANAANCSFGPMSTVLRGPKRGDWVDARIAAASSYASVLLTEDDAMKRRVNHITSTFGFPLVVMSSTEWFLEQER